MLLSLLAAAIPVLPQAMDSDTRAAASQSAHPNHATLFGNGFFCRPDPPVSFSAATSRGRVTVQTTLRPDLQQHLMRMISRSGPLIAAAVALDGQTGAVLAMGNAATRAGKSLLPAGAGNYCLYGGFPAASLAKIITAGVALEKKGFGTEHPVPVSGSYHTLYRSQLGIAPARSAPEWVTLDKAFALSINAYFGKLWLCSFADRDFLDLSRELLFNQPLAFDLPASPSRIIAPADAFERAEVASGYNTRTTISPLHAALIAALPLSGGRIMQPYLVKGIIAANGGILHRHRCTPLSRPLSARSAAQLSRLMQATVTDGTARRSFAGVNRIGEAHGWALGGKTGSIDLPGHVARCDWFAGFGRSGRAGIAVACILVHGEQRTMRSSEVGAELLRAGLDPDGKYSLPAPAMAKKTAGRKRAAAAVQRRNGKKGGRVAKAARAKKRIRVSYSLTGG